MKIAINIAINSLRTFGSVILFYSLMVVFHLGYGLFQGIELTSETRAGALVASAVITTVFFVSCFYFVYQVTVMTVGRRKQFFALILPLIASLLLATAGLVLYFFDEQWSGSETALVYIGYGAVGVLFSLLNYKVFIR